MYDEVLKFGFESWEVDSTNTIILKYMGDACFAKEDLQNGSVSKFWYTPFSQLNML